VDPHFGDNALLKKLVQKCHDNGIRVVLDAVFNHAGYFFEPFQDVIKNGQKSRYADWFHIRSFPIEIEPRPNYDVFAFTHMMPKLNTENAEVKEYLLKVARYWIEEIGIDGWRLDVANEVDHVFWRDFRKVVKEAKRDAYILGEVWHDSLPWLQGDQFDAIMNYPVAVSAISFFSKGEIDAEQFAAQVDNVFANYPQQINEVTFNVLDSHDTARLLNISGFNKDRMKLASTFQFTYIGTPCLYYGDEIGLDGEHDPGCRKSFEWDEAKQDRELHQFYQQLIHIRKSHESLRSGSFTFLLREKGSKQIAYSRKHKDETIVVVLNASEEKATITLPLENGTYVNLWTNESIEVTNHTCMLNAHGFGHYLFKKVGQL
jgi:glycosidase